MDGNIKFMIAIILLVGTMGVVDSASPSFGIFKQGECTELKQICFINGTICDSCNLTSIEYPNGTSAITDVEMNKRVADFNYTFCSTSAFGRYNVNGFCTFGSDVAKPFVAFFDINNLGEELTTGKGLIYIILTFFVFLLFLFVLYINIFLPYRNLEDFEGSVLMITKLKYFKIALIPVTHALFNWFLNLLLGISNNLLENFDVYYGMIGFILNTSMALVYPVFIFCLIWVMILWIKDFNFNKQIKKFGKAVR